MTQAKTALEDTKEDLDRAVQKTRDAAEIVRKLEASAPSAVEEPSADAPRRIVSLSETETQQEKIDLGDGYVARSGPRRGSPCWPRYLNSVACRRAVPRST